jgi:hypothetical protein
VADPTDTIAFRCSNSIIKDYVEAEFGEEFRAIFAKQKSAGGRQIVLSRMNTRMAGEAQRQEWYQYEDVGEPPHVRRQIKRDADGAPILLVPQVVLQRG